MFYYVFEYLHVKVRYNYFIPFVDTDSSFLNWRILLLSHDFLQIPVEPVMAYWIFVDTQHDISIKHDNNKLTIGFVKLVDLDFLDRLRF